MCVPKGYLSTFHQVENPITGKSLLGTFFFEKNIADFAVITKPFEIAGERKANMRIFREDETGNKEEISWEELIDKVKGAFSNPKPVIRNLLSAECFSVQVGAYTYRVA